MKALLYGLLVGAILAYNAPLLTTAQVPDGIAVATDEVVSTTTDLTCGNIIGPTSPSAGNEVVEPIEDCNDPFGVTTNPASPYTLFIEGEAVTDGATIEVLDGQTDDISYTGSPHQQFVDVFSYRHDGDDYRFQSLYPPSPEESDYIALVPEYFTDATSSALYSEIAEEFFNYNDTNQYFYYDNGEFVIDEVTGETVDKRFFDYINWVDDRFAEQVPVFTAGTYTIVFKEYSLFLAQETWWQNLRSWLVPTAYAQFIGGGSSNTYTITFTLVEEPPEPTGASSVLFLPGIQASTLYKGNDKVWPPDALFNDDVNDLRMNIDGQSIYDIHTKQILQTIPFGGTVYASFSQFMLGLVQAEIIESWTPFAYDWRYGVDDIASAGTKYAEGIRDAVSEIEYLAAGSFSGKVTIIAHSNGGLLAKAIMQRLEAEDKEYLVDKIVLLASPQLGTPKAIGTLLHGYDQADSVGGIIINAKSARAAINNMPGAYGLLPSEQYFNELSYPIVSFTPSAVTAPYQSVYGNQITNFNDFSLFLRGNDPFDRGLGNEPNIPARANGELLSEAQIVQSKLDQWIAPITTQIIEIVGTGLPTMKSIQYRGLIENECVVTFIVNVFCTPKEFLKPYAVLSHYGDGTVMQRSAEGYAGEKEKYFVNLKAIEEISVDNEYVHHNISEAPPVQDLLKTIIVGTTTAENQFISTLYTEFTDEYDIEVIDSPVRMLATDEAGNQTGVVIDTNGTRVIKSAIPGSQYFEFGDTKYLVVPKGTNRTTVLYGEEYGGYTLTTAELSNTDTQFINTVLANATVTPTMVATYSNTAGEFSTIETDFDGDGTIDFETTLEGEIILSEPVITYAFFLEQVNLVSMNKGHKQALLSLIKRAEHFATKSSARRPYKRLEARMLQVTERLIKLYIRKKFISTDNGELLLESIQVLKTKS